METSSAAAIPEMSPRLSNWLKHLDYRIFLPLSARLPLPLAYHLARLRGNWMFYSRQDSRASALANVGEAFPDRSPDEVRRIVRRYFQVLSCEEIETYWYQKPLAFLKRYITTKGLEELRAAVERKDSVVIFAPHFGSVGLFVVFLGKSGIANHPVLRPIGTPTNEFHPAHMKFARWRVRMIELGAGHSFIYTEGHGLFPIRSALRDGKPAVVLVDVLPTLLRRTQRVHFLGAPARFGDGIVRIQRSLNARLFHLEIVRDADWVHQKISISEFRPDRNASLQTALQQVVNCIESQIRAHPDHWHAWDALQSFR